jgi:hypothetical protein
MSGLVLDALMMVQLIYSRVSESNGIKLVGLFARL